MNCLLLGPDEWDSTTGLARVEGRRRQHAEEILKASAGETLRVGLIGGDLGQGEIVRLDSDCLELRVVFGEKAPAKRCLTLALALPRPPVFRRLLSCIATLGVERLLIIGTARTEGSFWQSHSVDAEEIEARLLLGLEQARDPILPEVILQRYFEGLVEETLPPFLETSRGIVAHPGAEQSCPHAVDEPVTLLVGPEGGFVDYEIERLESVGVEAVSLGERILRVEPAVPYLVGRLLP